MGRFLISIFLLFSLGYRVYSQVSILEFSNTEKRRFGKIRSYIRKTPKSISYSPQLIAQYISQEASSDLEKSYAAYYWIASNITYDMKSFLAGQTPPHRPVEVLRSKTAVCSGYAYLYKALCDEMSIETQILNGYSKGYGYNPTKPIEVSNHSWNSVKLNDRWFLIDATWAAAKVNTEPGVRPIETKYFLSHPKQFIIDHLPEDPRWQLLSPQLSLEDFENETRLKSQRQYALVVNDDVEHINEYETIGMREVALQKRILAFNPKNSNAEYKLGVALLYQALDTMDTMHDLVHTNVLISLPKYKYRIYELLDLAAIRFQRVPKGQTYESAQTFLSETTYEKGVFNYEAAQIIYDTTIPLEKETYKRLKEEFAQARLEYYKIALEYFKGIPTSSWYHENSQGYIRAIEEETENMKQMTNLE